MIAIQKHFSPLARLLHWVMAPLILVMLFVGIGWLLFFYPLDRALHMASQLFVR